MRVARLAGLRAADLPPLEAELGPGLVALVGTPEDAGEVRRALVWAGAAREGGLILEGAEGGAGLEALWGGAGGAAAVVSAAVGWIAGSALARVEAARAAAVGEVSSTSGPEGSWSSEDGDDLRARERTLRELRGEWAEIAGDVEEATMEWLRERQDAETQLQAYRDRARELKARLARLEAGGPDAPCPTCGRPLADHLKDVRIQLREEWEAVVQDGRWWKRRREQLEGKPEQLQALEGEALRVHAEVEGTAERLEVARAHTREREAERVAASRAAVAGGPPEARALDRLAGELGAAARAQVLREAGRVAERITAGRVLWIRDEEGEPIPEGIFPGGVPAPRDRAAAEVACRVAAGAIARTAGAPLGGIVMGEALDALDPEDRLRAVDALADLATALGQVVIVTGTDLVDLRPELFARAFELRAGGRGASRLRPLPVGTAVLRLTG